MIFCKKKMMGWDNRSWTWMFRCNLCEQKYYYLL